MSVTFKCDNCGLEAPGVQSHLGLWRSPWKKWDAGRESSHYYKTIQGERFDCCSEWCRKAIVKRETLKIGSNV